MCNRLMYTFIFQLFARPVSAEIVSRKLQQGRSPQALTLTC